MKPSALNSRTVALMLYCPNGGESERGVHRRASTAGTSAESERGELQARQTPHQHGAWCGGATRRTRRNTVATPSLMMEVGPSGLAARSQLVSNLAVAQLLVCFLAGLLRPDSFVVAPLVALYADTYVPGPPCCAYGLRVPASSMLYVPEAQGSLPRGGTTVRTPCAYQPQACHTYRGTPGGALRGAGTGQARHRAEG